MILGEDNQHLLQQQNRSLSYRIEKQVCWKLVIHWKYLRDLQNLWKNLSSSIYYGVFTACYGDALMTDCIVNIDVIVLAQWAKSPKKQSVWEYFCNKSALLQTVFSAILPTGCDINFHFQTLLLVVIMKSIPFVCMLLGVCIKQFSFSLVYMG